MADTSFSSTYTPTGRRCQNRVRKVSSSSDYGSQIFAHTRKIGLPLAFHPRTPVSFPHFLTKNTTAQTSAVTSLYIRHYQSNEQSTVQWFCGEFNRILYSSSHVYRGPTQGVITTLTEKTCRLYVRLPLHFTDKVNMYNKNPIVRPAKYQPTPRRLNAIKNAA